MPNTRGNERASALASTRRLLLGRDDDPIWVELANQITVMLAQCIIKNGLINVGKYNTLKPEAKKLVKTIRRSLRQMVCAARDPAAPGCRTGRKIIRDVSNGHINTYDRLAIGCQRFAAEVAECRRNAAASEPGNVPLGRGFYMRKVTAENVRQVGNEMQNCLANKEFSAAYKHEIRHGDIALNVICNAKRRSVVLVAFDPDAGELRHCKGRKNNCPSRYRDVIIVALRELNVSIGDCPDALALGISDSDLE